MAAGGVIVVVVVIMVGMIPGTQATDFPDPVLKKNDYETQGSTSTAGYKGGVLTNAQDWKVQDVLNAQDPRIGDSLPIPRDLFGEQPKGSPNRPRGRLGGHPQPEPMGGLKQPCGDWYCAHKTDPWIPPALPPEDGPDFSYAPCPPEVECVPSSGMRGRVPRPDDVAYIADDITKPDYCPCSKCIEKE